MNWCGVCGRLHMYGPCSVTVKNSDEAWRRLRKLIRDLAHPSAYTVDR